MLPRSLVLPSLVGMLAILSASDAVAGSPKTDGMDTAHKSNENPDWSTKIGGGFGVAPTYEGSKSYKVAPVPVASVLWKNRVFVGTEGVGVNVVRTDHARFGARLTYNGGRDQNDDDALNGLGNVDPTVEAGVFGSLHYAGFVLSADLRQDVGDGHGGMVGDVGLMYSIPLSSSLIGSFGPKVTWADDKYMQSYFGVSSAQATRSGLPQHDASAGVKSYGVTASLSYAVSDNWGVTGTIGYAHLADGLANSPVVQDRQQIMSAIFIAYQF